MKHKKRLWIGIASLTLTVLLFLAILTIQKAQQKEPVCQKVLRARVDISARLVLDEENMTEYLEIFEIPEVWLPKEYISDLELLKGVISNTEITAGTIITRGMFSEYETYYEIYEEPVWVSFSIDRLFQGVAGSLRRGDLIDIYCLKEEGQLFSCVLVAERVRIENACTSQGISIGPSGSGELAQLITIPMENRKVPEFYEMLAEGDIRIALHKNQETS